jgi:hypothetical protein
MTLAWVLGCVLSAGAAAPNIAPSDVFLRADYSMLSGAHLYKNGKHVGPGLFALHLDDAVRGVPAAELHASHATAAAITSWVFGIASLGFAVGSFTYHLNHPTPGNAWPLLGPGEPTEVALNLSWLVSLAGGIVARRIYDNELLVTVSEYNFALMRDVESQFE